ncbi:hypothetical protein [Coraliomargarita parva]|uniref:hypothetical protein n=1 Tax=Coraliomargarita parva TaxID=3014050 RepID=UPI0022B54B9D|nr:hypothetical protein [Coraliomargarita parva]
MYHAIQRNKSGSVPVFNEDTLTSSVFGQLLYLPVELLWGILKAGTYGNDLPETSGKLLNVEFWPHWNAENTSNVNFVEPDVFIEFDGLNLIVESKRNDDGQQRKDQWRNEAQAYRNIIDEDQRAKPLYLIAVGGLHSEESESLNIEENGCSVIVIKSRWARLLAVVDRLRKSWREQYMHSSELLAKIRIMDDLVELFEMHGYGMYQWLEDADFRYWMKRKSVRGEALSFEIATGKNYGQK